MKLHQIGFRVVAAYAGYDVNTAANSASIAVQNNSNSEIRVI